MFKNYFKIALRNLLGQRGFSLINVFGLAIGLAFCVLIFLFVRDELTYDRFHNEADRIFRARSIIFRPDGSIRRDNSNQPIALGTALQKELPEIEQVVRLRTLSHYVHASGEAVQENVLYADADIFRIFTFPFLQGNPETALAGLNNVVLTESAAKKFFSDSDVIGQTVWIRLMGTYEEFTVTGIAQDVPGNSTIRFQMLLPFEKLITAVEPFRSRTDHWGFVAIQTYVKLAEFSTVDGVEAKLTSFFNRHAADFVAEIHSREDWPQDAQVGTYRLEPLTNIHLTYVSSPTYSYILSGIAIAILLIACVNFMTLSIGRSSSRAKEIGIRKVVGARRTQLIGQFWGEAFILSLLALVLGVLFVEIFLPIFNDLSGKVLHLNYGGDWLTLAAMAGLILFAGLIAGSYPALLLSAFKPVETLKSRFCIKGSNTFTKSLVVMQFSLSLFLITGTLIMREQLEYIRSKNLGFNKEQIVVIPTHGQDGSTMARIFRNALANETAIVDITATNNTLGNQGHDGYRFEHDGRTFDVSVFSVEANYLDFMDLELAQGRNFDPLLTTDAKASIIVNETLVREFEIAEPLGSRIPGFSDETGEGPVIIGVVKDYNFQSLYQKIAPMMLTMDPEWQYSYVMARVRPDDIQRSLGLLRQAWQGVLPDVPFEYSFLDERMQAQYRDDQNWQRIVSHASVFAIVIACLGLFGLSALSVSQRTKEIGIRKVLGANVPGLVGLINKEFLILVLLGNLIAWPVSYFVMQNWLQGFAYRIEQEFGIFLLSALLGLLVAFLTVSYQSIRASLSDPVKSLRYE